MSIKTQEDKNIIDRLLKQIKEEKNEQHKYCLQQQLSYALIKYNNDQIIDKTWLRDY